MKLELGTSYLPGRIYFRELVNADSVTICGGTPWQKQTLRNRTFILSPNGVQRLVVPVIHTGDVVCSDGEMRIDYSLPWIREHKGALEAAYNTSPFFEFMRDELFAIYDDRPEHLFDLNFRILKLLLKKRRATTELIAAPAKAASLDNLVLINRKTNPEDGLLDAYPQVFGYKFGFVRGLSVLDEIVNQ